MYLFLIYEEHGDKPKALDYLEQGHKRGDPYASGELGYCYATGEYVQKDIKKALELFSIAAKAGIPGMEDNIRQLQAFY